MLFNSFDFIFFFVFIIFIYFVLPLRFRRLFLIAASYFFYMSWKIEYAILIVLSTLVDYFAAIKIASSQTKRRKKQFLILSLVVNLGLLFFFKYFNFFSGSFQFLFDVLEIKYNIPYLKFLLPVGISFYTFQTLSYTIDVYKGRKEPEKDLSVFALYVVFFPQLVAGPIERSTRLIPQLKKLPAFDYDRCRSGLLLMGVGFIKKLVIADRLALIVNPIYNQPEYFQGIPLIIATYCFAFQIYFDFSAYTDIARGAARGCILFKAVNLSR